MPADKLPLHELIKVDAGFHRSVHLERDYYTPRAAEGYIVVRASREALSLLLRGINQPPYRAQCILGPYGSGKSALALCFAHLLAGDVDEQRRQQCRMSIGDAVEDLIPSGGEGYLTVLATGTRENMAACLVRGLSRSLQKSGKNQLLTCLQANHARVFQSTKPSTREVTALFEDFTNLAVEKANALGVVVIIDELGKLLEHAAQYPEDGDVQVLQELAEASARSVVNPLWFITVLHRSFQEYADRVGRRHQQEWARVQGRFHPVPFSLDVVDSLQLVAGALDSGRSEAVSSNTHIIKVIEACAGFAPKEAREVFVEQALSCYPLHPMTLLNMPALFKRMGQNERSLFAFLTAEEPHSLLDWSRDQVFDPKNPPFLRLPDLCEYARNTLVSGAPVPTIAQAWAEIEEAIVRLGDAELELDVLKAIALLGFIGKTSCIHASKEVLELALTSPAVTVEQLNAAIAVLTDLRFIDYSRYWNAYRLQEGSDLNIAECLAVAETTLGQHSYTLSVARNLCPSQPIMARRHSFKTGMLRSFEIVACDSDNLTDEMNTLSHRDGKVLQCLVRNDEMFEDVASFLRQVENPALVFAIAKETDELEISARDITALEWIKTKYTNELRKDRVARRELSDRRLEAETAFRDEWERVFGPGNRTIEWIWRGEEQPIGCSRDLAQLLSRACDATFHLAPEVQNELINRRRLTSQAAAARRNLVEAMLTHAHEPMLGFDKDSYPPERAIYESLLLRSGIHRIDDASVWRIHPPWEDDRGLYAAWSYLDRVIIKSDLKPVAVNQLFDELSSPPYGIAEGFTPVLLTAYLLVYEARTALYEGKSFVAEMDAPAMERLMRRPETFSIVAYEIAGERKAVVERFATGFNIEVGVVPVVKYLYSAMKNLPDYTKKTSNLSTDAVAVRSCVDLGKSPERFLFIDLPRALGCLPFEADAYNHDGHENVGKFFSSLNSAFADLLQCYNHLLGRIRAAVHNVFDVSSAQYKDWRTTVAARASDLLEQATDTNLAVLARRAMELDLPEQEYLESIAAHIAEMPPAKWSREDEDRFNRRVVEFATAVRDAQSLGTLLAALGEGEDGCLISIDTTVQGQVRRVVRYSQSEKSAVLNLARKVLNTANGQGESRRLLLAALAEAARILIEKEREPSTVEGTGVEVSS